ncbi:MAG: helix-turn-helix transcriptional regulator [Thermogemmatispora sp.]|jgi:DNA-binding Xre family transcriptional regulator|uniref:helix-turn-helix domain-containing protein n=1 Tax=Thermogemmatispora sp. TaxID=1968838 RepID=UPI0019F027F0|nr:helix-turn-helix transcriptional regulator [Thermogemmatispora sp.]MBE3565051.1 helix-turn-helix transcriptional regulator [Thermogemmatispora sp.]
MPIRIKLRELAQQKGVSQSRLSRLADLNVGMIQRIYHDPYTNITLSTLEKLARALRVELAELIELDPPLEKEPEAGSS